MVFLDFQIMRIVFLVIVRNARRWLICERFMLSSDVSPSRQREEDIGMWQLKTTVSKFVMFYQKSLMGVPQCMEVGVRVILHADVCRYLRGITVLIVFFLQCSGIYEGAELCP